MKPAAFTCCGLHTLRPHRFSAYAIITATGTPSPRPWARNAITVNAICPGLVATERLPALSGAFLPEMAPEEGERAFAERAVAATPLGRLAYPLDIANATAFLASREAGYLTGIALTVAGGSHMG